MSVDDSGKGLVRYRDTDTWLTIGNWDAEPPRTWAEVADLAAAIAAGIGKRDAAGNTLVFEAPPAAQQADSTQQTDQSPQRDPAQQADPQQADPAQADPPRQAGPAEQSDPAPQADPPS